MLSLHDSLPILDHHRHADAPAAFVAPHNRIGPAMNTPYAPPYAEVIGDPIAQSKSPLIHSFWLDALGLTGDYRSEEHTSELQSLMRISYAVFCLQKTHAKNINRPDQRYK